MGNVGAGLTKALEVANKSLLSGYANYATIAVLVDGKAHGLISSGSADCEWKDSCDFELYEAAVSVTARSKELLELGLDLQTIIIDTEHLKGDTEWSEDSLSLATISSARYYHAPTLNDDILLRFIFSIKNLFLLFNANAFF
jgi:Mg-chelatase subunit ChlD